MLALPPLQRVAPGAEVPPAGRASSFWALVFEQPEAVESEAWAVAGSPRRVEGWHQNLGRLVARFRETLPALRVAPLELSVVLRVQPVWPAAMAQAALALARGQAAAPWRALEVPLQVMPQPTS